MDDLVWLTYDELAERLNIERESARQQVKRKRWARRPGNDGKVRIGVPVEVLTAEDTEGRTDPGQAPEQEEVRVPPPSPVHDPVVSEVLTRYIERLEQALETATNRASDRDQLAAERDVLTVQVEALRAALAAAEQDRNRWHEVATHTPEPAPYRPWWRRLAG